MTLPGSDNLQLVQVSQQRVQMSTGADTPETGASAPETGSTAIDERDLITDLAPSAYLGLSV